MTEINVTQRYQPRPEHAFDESAYTFMTFLYAAAVHLVIAKAFESDALHRASDVFLLSLILFLFSDWASRARLPRLLPENPAGYLYVFKIALEIVCVFFLVSSFLLFVTGSAATTDEESVVAPAFAFGCFLIFTSCWDYLMIYIMKQLNVTSLSHSVWITGRAIDMKEAREEYLGKFDNWKLERKNQIKKATEETTNKLRFDPDHNIKHMLRGVVRACRNEFDLKVFEAAIASVAQFLANHILQANAIAGTALILNAAWLKRSPLDALITKVASWPPVYDSITFGAATYIAVIGVACVVCASFLPRKRWVLLVTVIALGVVAKTSSSPMVAPGLKLIAIVAGIFLLSSTFYAFRDSTLCGLANRLGGWTIVGSLVLLYAMLPAQLLIALLAGQQVLVNAFLQLGVSAERPTRVVEIVASEESATGELLVTIPV